MASVDGGMSSSVLEVWHSRPRLYRQMDAAMLAKWHSRGRLCHTCVEKSYSASQLGQNRSTKQVVIYRDTVDDFTDVDGVAAGEIRMAALKARQEYSPGQRPGNKAFPEIPSPERA